MSIENELSESVIFELSHKSDLCGNAYLQAHHNEALEINIVGMGWKPFVLIDSSSYVVIVKPLDEPTETYWQVSKAHIIAIRSKIDFTDKYEDLVIKGVQEIKLDMEKRARKQPKPQSKPAFKPAFKPREQNTPTIQYKTKRVFSNE